MAEYAAVPFDHLLRLPKDDDESLARYTLAEPLAVAVRMVGGANPRRGERIAVIGDGATGLLTAYYLKRQGYESVLIGRHKEKIALARRLGLRDVFAERGERNEQNEQNEQIPSDLRGAFDCVFHTAGSQAAFELGFDLLGQGGRMICIGYLYSGKGLDPVAFNQLIREEKTVRGSYNYSLDDMKKALSLIVTNEIDPAPFLTRTVTMDSCIRDGFDALTSPDSLPGKVLIKP
jgi:threonine dehydrogenase-like Zn-dependent dehydrogenase